MLPLPWSLIAEALGAKHEDLDLTDYCMECILKAG